MEAVALETKAKDELCRVIFLVELALTSAHQVTIRLRGPAVRAGLEKQITTIEELVQLARDRACQL